jgi:hypothetical protein
MFLVTPEQERNKKAPQKAALEGVNSHITPV